MTYTKERNADDCVGDKVSADTRTPGHVEKTTGAGAMYAMSGNSSLEGENLILDL
ncbi:MAG: hypothetical protein H7Y30_00105 [Pyrinomonadaceae bacterium]|nr:hypothetical protein [Pyrinomonadaceae bacterium]